MESSSPSNSTLPRGRRRTLASLLLSSVLSSRAPTAAARSLPDREVLLRLYGLTNGGRWKRNDGWREAAEGTDGAPDVCGWYGVACDAVASDAGGGGTAAASAVTGLDLSDNHLKGKVPEHLWAMPSMRVVNLRGNLIHDAGMGGFDAAGESKAPVETIDLSENRLTTLAGIGSAPSSLKELHVGSNALEGDLPPEVFALGHVRVLRAPYNPGLTGTLPPEIGNMSELRELELSHGSIRGTVPTEVGLLRRLEFLGLDENRLHGPLPAEMEGLVRLRYLSIQNPGEGTGRITGPLLPFRDLSVLKELYLNDNGLTGTIPADFLENSAVTDGQVTVDLVNNRLSGHIPKELTRFEKLHLQVQGNRINGIPNELCSKDKWMKGRVKDFGCDAILCPKGTYAESGRRENEDVPCQTCPGGEVDAPHLGSLGCRAAADGAAADGAAAAAAGAGGAAEEGSAAAGPVRSNSLSGGAKFGIVAMVTAVVLVLGIAAHMAIVQRRHAMEDVGDGPDLFDAEANGDLRESGLQDVALGGAKSPSKDVSDGILL